MEPMATRTRTNRTPPIGYTRVSDGWHILRLPGRVFFGTSESAVYEKSRRDQIRRAQRFQIKRMATRRVSSC